MARFLLLWGFYRSTPARVETPRRRWAAYRCRQPSIRVAAPHVNRYGAHAHARHGTTATPTRRGAQHTLPKAYERKTVAQRLSPTPFYQHAEALLSPFMQCGVKCLDDFFSTVSGKALKGGYIVVVQTHGRNGQYNPHLHILATSGGWDAQAHKWVHLGYLPYPMLHKKWQWYALEMCREALKTDAMARLVKACYDKYPNGFVANVQKGDVPSRYQSLATYLAKYVVSPPISLRRIDGYDGQSVTYHYRSHKMERVERERVDVYTFIGRMIQHVFPKGFQRIRYGLGHMTVDTCGK